MMKWLLMTMFLAVSMAANGTVIHYRIPVVVDKFLVTSASITNVDNDTDDLYLSVDTATDELLSFEMDNKFFTVNWSGRTLLTYDRWEHGDQENADPYFVFGKVIDELVFQIAFELFPVPDGENVGEWLHHQTSEGYIVITESDTVRYAAYPHDGEKIVVPEPPMLVLALLALILSGFFAVVRRYYRTRDVLLTASTRPL